jgi:uncharacterized membrane protein
MKVLTVLIVLLALAGVIVSTMALKEHWSNEPSPCKINEVWDCGTVNKSPYAVFPPDQPSMTAAPEAPGSSQSSGLHIPVAAIGAVGYALMAALAGRNRIAVIANALLAVGAFCFALRLTYIEWKVLLTWCIYCVTSQSIIFVLMILAIVQAIIGARKPRTA